MRIKWVSLTLLGLLTTAVQAGSHSGTVMETKPTVLITGSNRGIGFEFVRQFSAKDWRIIATARNPDQAADLKEMAQSDPDIIIETLDVTDDEEIAALKKKYADQPIDLLLLNAAKGPSGRQALKDLDFEDGAQTFQVNAFGPMKLSQAFFDNVKASEKKQIIAISSDSGSFVAGSQWSILWHYKASKAALNMYMHTLSFEAGQNGVTVIMLHPGLVATNPGLASMEGVMQTPDSVSQMMKVLANITPEDNGRFIDYRGESMPW